MTGLEVSGYYTRWYSQLEGEYGVFNCYRRLGEDRKIESVVQTEEDEYVDGACEDTFEKLLEEHVANPTLQGLKSVEDEKSGWKRSNAKMKKHALEKSRRKDYQHRTYWAKMSNRNLLVRGGSLRTKKGR